MYAIGVNPWVWAYRGVSIGVEALNRYETSVVNTVGQALELIDGLPANVGVMIDTYHCADRRGSLDDGAPAS